MIRFKLFMEAIPDVEYLGKEGDEHHFRLRHSELSGPMRVSVDKKGRTDVYPDIPIISPQDIKDAHRANRNVLGVEGVKHVAREIKRHTGIDYFFGKRTTKEHRPNFGRGKLRG